MKLFNEQGLGRLKARHDEVEQLVRRRHELAMQDLFSDIDHLVETKELNLLEALVGLSLIDDKLSVAYESWVEENLG